ncbi:hypothetical protein MNBD_GAMMA21-510 [hydrothermal vent metagenome]|uniref:DUF4388 domain-containing protein n=1 Tax=hydrothermal vent metagenome TaxID=652676 RepID=A0A3B0ZWB0_9ZZZZ
MENSQVIRISSAGLKDIDLKVLEVAHALLTDEGILCELLNPSDMSGEVIVMDIDDEDGKELYTKVRESQIKILLTNNPIVSKNTISLKKPTRVTTLKEIMAQICKQLYEYIARHTQSQNSPESEKNNQTSPLESSLFQILFLAKKGGKYLKITDPDGNNIFVDGSGKTVYSDSEQVIPTTFIVADTKNITVSEFNQKEFKSQVKDITPHALDAELWHTGIECSKGKLLPGHRTDVAVKLKAWPNFSRQGFKAEFFKIAAHIAKQPISLDELSKISQVPLNIIIDFYNAAFSVGLIDTDTANINRKIPQKCMPPTRKTLLGKLAERLKFA